MLRKLLVALLSALALTGTAQAAGGNYVFDGGTPSQQQQVRSALQASSFNWSLVPAQITITIAPSVTAEAVPGHIWLTSGLLDSGQFSWGVVQHEYAHQVDFFLLDDAAHARLQTALGAPDWCYGDQSLQHSQYGCERFASTLAWAYWSSASNCLKPLSAKDEAGAMAPAAFRTLLASLLGPAANPQTPTGGSSTIAYAPTVVSMKKTVKRTSVRH